MQHCTGEGGTEVGDLVPHRRPSLQQHWRAHQASAVYQVTILTTLQPCLPCPLPPSGWRRLPSVPRWSCGWGPRAPIGASGRDPSRRRWSGWSSAWGACRCGESVNRGGGGTWERGWERPATSIVLSVSPYRHCNPHPPVSLHCNPHYNPPPLVIPPGEPGYCTGPAAGGG